MKGVTYFFNERLCRAINFYGAFMNKLFHFIFFNRCALNICNTRFSRVTLYLNKADR